MYIYVLHICKTPRNDIFSYQIKGLGSRPVHEGYIGRSRPNSKPISTIQLPSPICYLSEAERVCGIHNTSPAEFSNSSLVPGYSSRGRHKRDVAKTPP